MEFFHLYHKIFFNISYSIKTLDDLPLKIKTQQDQDNYQRNHYALN